MLAAVVLFVYFGKLVKPTAMYTHFQRATVLQLDTQDSLGSTCIQAVGLGQHMHPAQLPECCVNGAQSGWL